MAEQGEEEAIEKERGGGERRKKGERRSYNAIIQLRAHIVLAEESEDDLKATDSEATSSGFFYSEY